MVNFQVHSQATRHMLNGGAKGYPSIRHLWCKLSFKYIYPTLFPRPCLTRLSLT